MNYHLFNHAKQWNVTHTHRELMSHNSDINTEETAHETYLNRSSYV